MKKKEKKMTLQIKMERVVSTMYAQVESANKQAKG
jgi:hypothetical protein